MPKFSPKIFENIGTGKSGFSMSVAEAKAGQYIRLGLTSDAQKRAFGGELNPEADGIKLILSNERGSNHLMSIELVEKDDPEAFSVSSSARGSIFVKLAPWTRLAPGKRPPSELTVSSEQPPKCITLKIPDWARPEVPKIGQGKSIMD